MVGLFEKHEIHFTLFWEGDMFNSCICFIYNVHSSPFLCVCVAMIG